MNLKFPLLNLIARGHLPLANRTASLNFAKNLDEGPATKICFEMLKFENVKDSALFLEEAQREFLKLHNSVPVVIDNDAAFRHQRDAILLREDNNPRQGQEEYLPVDRAFIRIFKTTGPFAAVGYYITRPANQKAEIDRTLKKVYPSIYKQLQNNWLGRFMGLPKDKGEFFKRLANTALGKQKENGSGYLTKKDVNTLHKFFDPKIQKFKRGALIATGIAAAIVGISLLYKRFFSEAAKQCKNLSGKARTVCMTKARIKACDAAIAEAEKNLIECSSAKNEEECIFKMKVEIRSWKKKKLIEEEKLRKLMNVNKSAFGNDKPANDPFQ